MHFGRHNQLRDYRREGIYEYFPVTCPAPGIWKVDGRAAPTRPQKRARHVPFDRTQQSRNHRGLELADRFRKRSLAGPASRPPRFGIEIINRSSTEIDQIATRRLKDRKKVLVVDCGIDHPESVAHRPIKPGVALVEEAPGSRSRFPNEEQAHLGGAKRPPQFLSLAACGIKRQRGLPSLPDRHEFRPLPGPRSSGQAFHQTA